MDFYIFFGILIFLLASFPFLRLFIKRLILFLRLKRKKDCILEAKFKDFFSPLRFSKGFDLIKKDTQQKTHVYIISSYNFRNSLEFTESEYRIKKFVILFGGRIGSSNTFSWHTELKSIPDYIKGKNENSYILLNPIPFCIKYNNKELFLGDKMLDKEIINATNLLKRF